MVLSNEDKMKLFSRLLNYEKKNAASAAGSVRKTTTRSRKQKQPSRKQKQQPSRKQKQQPASIRSKSRSKAQTNKKVHDLAPVSKRQRPTQQPSRKRQRSSAATVSTNTTAATYQRPLSQVGRPVQVINRSTVARGGGGVESNIDIMVDEE